MTHGGGVVMGRRARWKPLGLFKSNSKPKAPPYLGKSCQDLFQQQRLWLSAPPRTHAVRASKTNSTLELEPNIFWDNGSDNYQRTAAQEELWTPKRSLLAAGRTVGWKETEILLSYEDQLLLSLG